MRLTDFSSTAFGGIATIVVWLFNFILLKANGRLAGVLQPVSLYLARKCIIVVITNKKEEKNVD